MEFTFERTDTPALERYEIALLLDRKKMKEPEGLPAALHTQLGLSH